MVGTEAEAMDIVGTEAEAMDIVGTEAEAMAVVITTMGMAGTQAGGITAGMELE